MTIAVDARVSYHEFTCPLHGSIISLSTSTGTARRADWSAETVVVPDAHKGLPSLEGIKMVGRTAFLDGKEPIRDLDLPQPWDISCIVYT